AVENQRQGRKPEMPADDLELPAELVDALDADNALREAWEALTPGRRRGWVITFAQPKKAETRVGRIEKAREKILAGRGIHDR
ncbi:MAG: YdeI/OmpD-associated family protein, partial [Pseudomonadota bacterium]